MPRVFVGVGSNVDRAANVRAAIEELRRLFGKLTLSPVYESVAVGFDGDNFYNLVAAFDTGLDAAEVVTALHAIEMRLGRTRAEARFAARTIDLDLLLYGEMETADSVLQLPRPDIDRYAFVLRPLADIAGDARHPVSGERFGDMWRRFGNGSQELWPVDFEWGGTGAAGAEDS